jgi:hypothetical protein
MSMSFTIENQMGRVVDAFRKAANKHWGSEEPQKSWTPEKRTRGKSPPKHKSTMARWVKGEETPKQRKVREYLEHNPQASALDASKSTCVSYKVCKRVEARLEKSKETA